MNDMPNIDTDSKLSREEKQLRSRLAMALWMVENREANKAAREGDKGARREAFNAEKKEYMKKAVALQKVLARRGLSLELSADAPADAEVDA